MADLKTKKTHASVDRFLKSLTDPQQREDSRRISSLMQEVTGEKPAMWGDSIIGFGERHYEYDSGHSGDCCMIGFAPRKGKFSLYLTCDLATLAPWLAKLGKHKTGVGCLYIQKLEDVDFPALRKLVEASLAPPAKRAKQPTASGDRGAGSPSRSAASRKAVRVGAARSGQPARRSTRAGAPRR